MTVPRPESARGTRLRGALAIGLIALAVLFAVLYHRANSSEDHSYNAGATPPVNVALTQGRQYEISTPGGLPAVEKRGGSASALNCNYTAVGGRSTSQLDTTSLGTDTRTTHAVATFIAPVSGLVHIECRALTSTFIDDADHTSADPAGLYILLCTISLALATMVGLSALYRRGRSAGGRRRRADREPPDQYGYLLAPPGEGRPPAP